MALCPAYQLWCCPPNLAEIALTPFVGSALATGQFPEGADRDEENLTLSSPHSLVHRLRYSLGNK